MTPRRVLFKKISILFGWLDASKSNKLPYLQLNLRNIVQRSLMFPGDFSEIVRLAKFATEY